MCPNCAELCSVSITATPIDCRAGRPLTGHSGYTRTYPGGESGHNPCFLSGPFSIPAGLQIRIPRHGRESTDRQLRTSIKDVN